MVLLKKASRVVGSRVRKPLKRHSSKKKLDTAGRGIIKLSNTPHGFYEHEMRRYFSQFGDVTRVRVARSKKTGRSRHYAFIEFQYEEVAKIVAETMNGYMMFGEAMKCEVIPYNEVERGAFQFNKINQIRIKNRMKYIAEHNRKLVDPEKIAKRQRVAIGKRRALQKKLNALGIDYDVMNIKKNELFVPPPRQYATKEDLKELRANVKVSKTDGRCSDFEYSDDEDEMEEFHVRETLESHDEPDTLEMENAGEESMAIEEKDLVTEESVVTDDPDVVRKDVELQDDDDDFNVMVVDHDDSEITFRTPPAEAKIKRRALANGQSDISKKTSLKSSAKRKRRQAMEKLQKSLCSDDDDAVETPAKTPVKKKMKQATSDNKLLKKTKRKAVQ